VIDVKWQYLILAAVFIGAMAVSLWTATRVDMHDIERGLTNISENEHEGIIEGGNVLLYIAIVVILVIIAIAAFIHLAKYR
jgi:heme/copper-type cytochrome/quinol oxidase subunit 2